eukprot:TRINITY_DN14775_c1_g1_i2.p1 TRINITY_DN14775_c1_g1~~TRINITY_DN14775_c1_g1_i2.p1  ORF type:complete len:219 (-),score=37.23 TRINITY_DN14775_c1_g1_i2:131-787(-)
MLKLALVATAATLTSGVLGQQPPTSYDWRTKGAVTPVEDEGMIGDASIYSCVGAVESAWKIAGHDLQELSVPQAAKCAGMPNLPPLQCLQWVQKHGILAGSAANPPCVGFTPAAEIRNIIIPKANEDALAAALVEHGPVSVTLSASSWQAYDGGVLSRCGTTVDHAALIVGYGVDPQGTPYWSVKNSWGTNWGEQGYIRLLRGNNTCNILSQPLIPQA